MSRVLNRIEVRWIFLPSRISIRVSWKKSLQTFALWQWAGSCCNIQEFSPKHLSSLWQNSSLENIKILIFVHHFLYNVDTSCSIRWHAAPYHYFDWMPETSVKTCLIKSLIRWPSHILRMTQLNLNSCLITEDHTSPVNTHPLSMLKILCPQKMLFLHCLC